MYHLTNRISSLVLALFFLGTFSILPTSPSNLSATTSATTINESELIAKRGDGKHGGGHRHGHHHHHGGKHHHHSVGHRGGHQQHHHGHSHGWRGNYGYGGLYGIGLGLGYPSYSSYRSYPSYSSYRSNPYYSNYSNYTTPYYVYPDDDTTYYYYSLPVVYDVY